ncbi:MAG: hypothetical protein EAZ08_02860 [Cytophagales bacterium]|nr:MAG: hypothetical protein EAZ08_02860 [Cytophagales bacterium]
MQNISAYHLRLTMPQIIDLIKQIDVDEKLFLLNFLVQEVKQNKELSQKEKIKLQLLEVQALNIFSQIKDASVWQTQIRSEWV